MPLYARAHARRPRGAGNRIAHTGAVGPGKGVYQHCSKRHLHRYLSEFDFRYSARVALGVGDAERADRALRGIVGKRLTYRHSSAR